MIKEVIKGISSISAPAIPLSFYRKLTGNPLIVTVYHLISDNPPVHIKHLYSPRTIQRFRQDIDFLLRNFRVIYPDMLEAFITGQKEIVPNGFILTFDDGLREIYEIVAPYLYYMGIPAIFFINNDFVGNENLFFRFKASIIIDKIEKINSPALLNQLFMNLGLPGKNRKEIKNKIFNLQHSDSHLIDKTADILQIDFKEYLKVYKPYMDAVQILELQEKGFLTGAHSNTHPLLSSMSEREILTEIKVSMNDFIHRFSPRFRLFAFPFTDHGIPGSVLHEVHDPGNPLADVSFGTAGLKNDIVTTHIQRIPMEKTLHSCSAIIKNEYFMSLTRRMVNKNTILRSE